MLPIVPETVSKQAQLLKTAPFVFPFIERVKVSPLSMCKHHWHTRHTGASSVYLCAPVQGSIKDHTFLGARHSS